MRAARREQPLRLAATLLSHGGRGGLVWPALGFVFGGGRRGLRRVEPAIVAAAAVGSSLAISTALARAFDRKRPCEGDVQPLVPCPDGGSFPSDQTAAAFAGGEVIAWSAPAAGTALRLTAAATALARVAAGVHYPSDVIAGGVLGVAVGRTATAVARRLLKRH